MKKLQARETLKNKLRTLRRRASQPIVPLTLFIVWMFTIVRYYGWKPGVLALFAAIAAVARDRCR